MKSTLEFSNQLLLAIFLALAPAALASTTWYVNGVSGSNKNNCKSPEEACKTIGHAISLAASGDAIMVAAATYNEHLTIGISLKVIGSSAATTIIDGGGLGHQGHVVTISAGAQVALSNFTVQNGWVNGTGSGIANAGTLLVNNCIVTKNTARGVTNPGVGAGIQNGGVLTLNNSTVSGNAVNGVFGAGVGGGLGNQGVATINNSTFSGNSATSIGGGIYVDYGATVTINNSTFSGNQSQLSFGGGSIDNNNGKATIQNSIVANSPSGVNCYSVAPITITSKGYNLSSDNSCNFNGPGDLNDTEPKLGTLGNHGGPTPTIPEMLDSPTVDAGNPSGCRDSQGHLLKTDQRGYPRPGKDKHDHRCDMGAYERQTD